MDKKKAILHIDSFSTKDGIFSLSVDDPGVSSTLGEFFRFLKDKYNGYIKLEMSPPYRARTTGPGSQNNLAWKLITEIAKETGNDLHDVEEAAKERAVKRGYPYRQNKITGQIKPVSMTEISTVEAG
jgi:hypothetical protein